MPFKVKEFKKRGGIHVLQKTHTAKDRSELDDVLFDFDYSKVDYIQISEEK